MIFRTMSRFRKILTLLGRVALWGVILFVICVVMMRIQGSRANIEVSSVHIKIADSTSRGNLVTTQMVHQILRKAKIETMGAPIEALPLSRIERVIGENGFVESVRAYSNMSGELHIEINQRSAVARLLLNGYNCYITKAGFVFPAPSTTALYTSVVTGDYKPFFPSGFVGNIDDYLLEQIAKIDLEIEAIEREKYPIIRRELQNNEDKRDVRKRYINRSIFEDQDEFAQRVEDLREENRLLREKYAYRQRVIDQELAAIDQRIGRLKIRQKKLHKSCDDIHNLITFVGIVENDDFWRSEVVQIILSTGVESQMRVGMSVRSASFNVTLGSLKNEINWVEATKSKGHSGVKLLVEQDEKEQKRVGVLDHIIPNSFNVYSEQKAQIEKNRRQINREVGEAVRMKLSRLRDFYQEALPRVGWDRYKEISVEFENQVVCKR